MLVDSHCHLDFPDFADDLEEVVTRAKDAGIGAIVTVSTRVRRLADVLTAAERFDHVFCSVGTHPHNAHEELDITAQELARLAEHPKVVAIGEAGLDYHYDNSPREAQASGLRTHIAAARDTGLPVIIHARAADADLAAILREETERGAFPAVLHCFSSGRTLAEAGLECGHYVSFSGILTFSNAANIREIARGIPADRILVETDAPFLAPAPNRGKRNEPAFVRHTAAILAELRGMSREDLNRQTSENFFRLFSKARRP
jgi:TatD DNase family protein